MIPALRQSFNSRFSPGKYRNLLTSLEKVSRTPVQFRVSETPCFLPESLLDTMCRYGCEFIQQLQTPDYCAASSASVPADYRVAKEDATPTFLQVDFGLVHNETGQLEPKLVELQAFPSLYGYQPLLAQTYIESYGLSRDLNIFLRDLRAEAYWKLLREIIVGDSNLENVVLLELDPLEQKTLPDFLITQDRLGIAIVNIRELVKDKRRLFYRRDGRLFPIQRIYNRCIVDELVRKGVSLPFDLRAEIDVEWVGHPNWYFKISKFSIPYLKHRSVPHAWFLDELDKLPADRENYLLKPLYSFAGAGIKFAPTDEDIAAIPSGERHNYLLQERIQFTPVIATPHGDTYIEVRIMYLWPKGGDLVPVLPLIRMGRGKMMGVDHNRNLEWVGSSAALIAGDA
jgi:hypothetical protein